MSSTIEAVGRIVAETGMGWREALEMPEVIRESVISGIEEKMDRRADLEEERFKALSKMLGG